MKKTMTAYEKIQMGKKNNEKLLLKWIREGEKKGNLWNRVWDVDVPFWHALDRLEAAKKIRYDKKGYGYRTVKSTAR